LAYLTAATYGLDAQAEDIAAALGIAPQMLPEVNPQSRVLVPPEPVCADQGNWPLLTINKVLSLADKLGPWACGQIIESQAGREKAEGRTGFPAIS
jgi:hypothetical protein